MTEEKREILLKVDTRPVARFEVTYRDKNELYEKYTEWIRSLNLPPQCGNVFCCDGTGTHTGVANAGELLNVVKERDVAKFFIPKHGDENFCWCDPDAKIEKTWIPGIPQAYLDINPNLTLDKIDCGCDDCMGPDFYEKLGNQQ